MPGKRRNPRWACFNLRENVSLTDKTGPVAAPVAASPARALVEELGAVLQSGLKLALLLVLDPCLPLMADEPASDKVVVVGVEDVLAPLLGLEALKEVVAGQNLRSVGTSSARHAGCTAIEVVRGRDLEVASLNVSSTEPVEDASGQRAIPDALNSLAGADATNLGVFEGSEDPGHHGRRPGDIVVGHDGELGRNLG